MNGTIVHKPLAIQRQGRLEVEEYDAFATEETVDLPQYWRLIKKGKWSILSMTLSCLIIGALIAARAIPIYQATVKVLADPQQINANSTELYVASTPVALFYETQYEIIGSRNIAESVVDKLELVEKYKLAQQKSEAEEPSALSKALGWLKAELSALFGSANETPAPVSDADLRVALAAGIQGRLRVNGGTQSQIISISYTSPDPREAADIVNALADTYIQFGLESRLKEVKDTSLWLSEQSTLLRTKLQDSETALSEYRLQQGLVDTTQQARLADTQLQGLISELIRAQTSLSAIEEQYIAIQNVDVGSEDIYSVSPVLQNETARQMVQGKARLSQRVDELLERYGEKHPQLIAARSELNSATASLTREVNKVVENIKNSYQLARLQVDNINKLITERRNEIQALQGSGFSLITLEREVENNRKVYENFQENLISANINSEYKGSNVQIIDRATVPKTPINNNRSILSLAGMFGVVLGLALIFIREALDNTFRTPDDIEHKLQIPALGIIPFVKQEKNSVTSGKEYLQNPRSPFAESINMIRTSLLFSNIDNPPKTILITSATGSEGKSTLALNLAAAFSKLGATLLLEVDLRKPSIAKNFGFESKKGLTDLIGSSKNIEESILQVKKKQQYELTVISCGTLPVNPLELLSSQKFDTVLQLLKKHFDYIIMDAPPTLPVSDSCILGNKVDGVIFTVKAEETKIKVAREAVSRLQQLNANVIGAVLTVVEPQRMSYYGDYYYSGKYYGSEIPAIEVKRRRKVPTA